MKNRSLLFFLSLIVSCNDQKTAMYYYQGKINNGKYILASDLDSFFGDTDMKKVVIKDESLYFATSNTQGFHFRYAEYLRLLPSVLIPHA